MNTSTSDRADTMREQFNAEQWTAITSGAKNLLVLAGAGTGKTRTIIGRAAYLLQQGVDPESLVIITFTRRAAAEIRHRLLALSGGEEANEQMHDRVSKIITGTFHNFCLREMKTRRNCFGFDDITVMDRDDQMQLMKRVRGKVPKGKSLPQSAELINLYSFARNTNQPLREYLEKYTDHRGDSAIAIEKLCEAYKERKRQSGYFDYDDILQRFAQVMRQNEEVRRRVGEKFSHVLVDEMQDTNPLQWLILQSLAEQASLFCVGDDAQSIYAFRGADFQNVHAFDQRLEAAETLKLQRNYRSTQEILDLANWLLDRAPLEYNKRLTASRGTGVKPRLLEFFSEYEEAEWIVNAVVQRQREGQKLSEQMILCRTGNVARPVEGLLIDRGIAYRFIGGVGLLQMAHVKDLLSGLRAVVNLRDEIGWMRYLTLWPRIGEVTATRLLDAIWEATSMQQAVDTLLKLQPSRDDIVQPLLAIDKHAGQPAKAIRRAAELLEPLMESKYENWNQRRRDFELLEQLAGRHRSLDTFLETYTLDPISATEANPRDQEDVLTLITVHSAKGTESKTCYVVAAQAGNYPHFRSLGDPEAIEEERRVLYVALTRAMDELIVTRNLSQGHFRSSWKQPQEKLDFLESIPVKLVDSQTITDPSEPLFDPLNFSDDDVIR